MKNDLNNKYDEEHLMELGKKLFVNYEHKGKSEYWSYDSSLALVLYSKHVYNCIQLTLAKWLFANNNNTVDPHSLNARCGMCFDCDTNCDMCPVATSILIGGEPKCCDVDEPGKTYRALRALLLGYTTHGN
jgi:hypothetical protein